MSLTAPAPGSRAHRLIDGLVFFRWWVRAGNAVEAWPSSRRYALYLACAVAAVIARLWAQTLPGNYDFRLWDLTSTAVLDGQDPYALYGYNYPPMWLAVIAGVKAVTSDQTQFRLGVSLILCAVDIVISLLLVKRGYLLPACIFLLSPITIAISGQHQQIDALAIALAFAALVLAGRKATDRITGTDLVAVALLGLSLSVKEVFLILPLWLAMRGGNWQKRALYLIVPYIIVAACLGTAMLRYSPHEVVHYVLFHSGANNSPLVWTFIPSQFAPWFLNHSGGKVLFLVLLIAAGWLFRRLPMFEAGLAYTLTAVLLSWAVVNQYLAIPMAAAAVYLNAGLLVWLLLASIYLMGSAEVLNLWGFRVIQPNLLLEYNVVMRNLFPWLLIGWGLMVVALHRPGLHLRPRRPDPESSQS